MLYFRWQTYVYWLWFIAWSVLLRAFLGKDLRNKLLASHPEINNLIRFRARAIPFIHAYGFLIIRSTNSLVYVKLPDGILVQPEKTLSTNREIYIQKVYDRFHEIGEDDTVIDAGAHVGIFTLKAAGKARWGLVIAVEPHPSNFRLLVENIKRNKLEHIVVPLNIALTDCNGEAKLYFDKDLRTASISSQRWTKGSNFVKVKTKTLDSMVDELKVREVNFIKIDAEGAELDILKGARDVLKTGKDLTLAIAAYHYPGEAQEVARFLSLRGFKIFSRGGYVYGKKFLDSVESGES